MSTRTRSLNSQTPDKLWMTRPPKGAGMKRVKHSLTTAEGGQIISGALASQVTVEDAFKDTEAFQENPKDLFPDTEYVLLTNRPFVTTNIPCDPPPRNHLNQIPGGVQPGQLVPLLVRACRRAKHGKRKRMTRSFMLRHMRVIGRSEESSSAQNLSPIAVIRVGGMANFYCELADENGKPATVQSLRLTAGCKMFVTLPAWPWDTNEFMLTPFDPTAKFYGREQLEMSDLSRAVLAIVLQAADVIRIDDNGQYVMSTIETARQMVASFGDEMNDGLPVFDLADYTNDDDDDDESGDLHQLLVSIAIRKIRFFAANRSKFSEFKNGHVSISENDLADVFDKPGVYTCEMALAAFQTALRTGVENVQEKLLDFYPKFIATDSYDSFLGIGKNTKAEQKTDLRMLRFGGAVMAGNKPPYAAIRMITNITANAVEAELLRRNASYNSSNVRSDLYLGRYLGEEMDGSIRIQMSS